ncbi:RING-type domain-containing protein [Caenorhabditis elegans]|uniref:RING-type domain-containing protein n=1 Tax=Caenorhabditis elegans TaxID=6239 RepID=Q9U5C2_CAEEL|nr:RING-type domain-containing protein [Caenorhabditis elegans]CCD69626.1 RING-type domain-containing protein [Caenorhabditis elegans]|eukprot:NP_494244.2 Uncharacterized protein CELE_F43C11.8 [Caenorhabditis elegans]
MSFIECEICNEDFSSATDENIPRILRCGHTICHGCAEKLLQNSMILCPFCREATNVSTVKDLQKNFALLQAVEHAKTRTEEKDPIDSPPKCASHQYNFAEFVCIEPTCSSSDKLMCRTCEEFGAHAGHNRGLLQSEAAKLRQFLSGKLSRSEDLASKIDANIEKIGTAQLTNLDDGEVFQEKKVSIIAFYASIRETLDALENDALATLQNIAETNFFTNDLLIAELSESLNRQKRKSAELKLFMKMSNADLLAVNSALEVSSENELWTEFADVEPEVFDAALIFPEMDRLVIQVTKVSRIDNNLSREFEEFCRARRQPASCSD